VSQLPKIDDINRNERKKVSSEGVARNPLRQLQTHQKDVFIRIYIVGSVGIEPTTEGL